MACAIGEALPAPFFWMFKAAFMSRWVSQTAVRAGVPPNREFLGTLSPQPEQIWGVSRGLLPPPTDGTRSLSIQRRKARPRRRYRHTSGLSAQTFREPVGFLLSHAPNSVRRRAERPSPANRRLFRRGRIGARTRIEIGWDFVLNPQQIICWDDPYLT